MIEKFAIVGGAGFIGSHFTEFLLSAGHQVTVIDNFCSGTQKHIRRFYEDVNFQLEVLDVEDTDALIKSFTGADTVLHLASNPDIAAAASDPRIDFTQGTVLTESVAEAARITKVKTILYASGSGVYGDAGNQILTEASPLNPISTYGASKLAGEALLASYSFMFGIRTLAFRFANVVGGMQTHGVGYDFLRKLSLNRSELAILGDGTQNKSYVHISDIISGVLLAHQKSSLRNDVFNISTDDSLTVTEIAKAAIDVSKIDFNSVKLKYSGGDRGWKADVPIVILSADKIKSLGWKANFSSRTAMNSALEDMYIQIRAKHEK